MTSPRASDLMTQDVVTIPPTTPVAAIARLLADRGISAVPVVEPEGSPSGIVTEADLIRRLAGQEDTRPGWLASLFGNPSAQADRYSRTHGMTARDVMTTELVTVTPDTPVTRIAHLLETRHIRRVLVVEDGKLRGIVSRADLLRALTMQVAEQAENLSDERIRRAVLAAMRREPWADTFYTLVDVKDGVVEFHGFSRTEAVQRGLRVLAENIPGVKGVVDNSQPMPPYLYASV